MTPSIKEPDGFDEDSFTFVVCCAVKGMSKGVRKRRVKQKDRHSLRGALRYSKASFEEHKIFLRIFRSGEAKGKESNSFKGTRDSSSRMRGA